MLEPTNSSVKKLKSINDWRRAVTSEMRSRSRSKIANAGDYYPDFSTGRNKPGSRQPYTEEKYEFDNQLVLDYAKNKHMCKLEEIEGKLFNQANSVEEYHRLIEEKCQVLAKHCDDCAKNGREFIPVDEEFSKELRSLIVSNATEEAFLKFYIPKIDEAVDKYYF